MATVTPFGMMIASVYLALQNQAILKLSEIGFQLSGPVGTPVIPWSSIRRYDILGTQESGLKLFTRDGKSVAISIMQFEDGSRILDLILPRIQFDDGQEPLITEASGKRAIPWIMFGTLSLVVAAALSLGDRWQSLLPIIVILVIVTVPLVTFTQTYKIELNGAHLKLSSCYGKTELLVGPECTLSTKLIQSRNGKSEQLTVTGPSGKKITLYSRQSRYLAFKSRIEGFVNG